MDERLIVSAGCAIADEDFFTPAAIGDTVDAWFTGHSTAFDVGKYVQIRHLLEDGDALDVATAYYCVSDSAYDKATNRYRATLELRHGKALSTLVKKGTLMTALGAGAAADGASR